MSKLCMLVAACLMSSPVLAEPVVVRANPDELPTARVSFADLNLSSAAGQKELRERIGRAAADVCFFSSGTVSLYQYIAERGCFRTARADGFRQMERVLESRSLGLAIATSSIVIAPR